jgi:hypothetical protein
MSVFRRLFEKFIDSALDNLPHNITHPLRILCDYLGIEPSDLILYVFASIGIVLLFFRAVSDHPESP